MKVPDGLQSDFNASIKAVTANLIMMQQELVIDGLDSLFRSFREWGIPGDAILMGVETALENNYGLRVTEMETGGDED